MADSEKELSENFELFCKKAKDMIQRTEVYYENHFLAKRI